jgi:hypothetical protein
MKRFRLVLMLSLLVASITTVAYSLPSHSSETDYYSDDTFTEQVGVKYVTCNGPIYREGETTSWWIQYGEACQGFGSYCNQSYYDAVAGQWYVINCY